MSANNDRQRSPRRTNASTGKKMRKKKDGQKQTKLINNSFLFCLILCTFHFWCENERRKKKRKIESTTTRMVAALSTPCTWNVALVWRGRFYFVRFSPPPPLSLCLSTFVHRTALAYAVRWASDPAACRNKTQQIRSEVATSAAVSPATGVKVWSILITASTGHFQQ